MKTTYYKLSVDVGSNSKKLNSVDEILNHLVTALRNEGLNSFYYVEQEERPEEFVRLEKESK